MTALQNAAAMLRDLTHHPDSFSSRDRDLQTQFARLVFGRKAISEAAAYAAYEASVRRENSYAALVGSPEIEIVRRAGFLALVRAIRLERQAPYAVMRRATLH